MYRCQICFDELGTNGQTTCTPCGHAFCSDCLAHALRIQAFCPSCRSPVEPKLETLPAVEAQALITELCRKTPGRRHELERLGPRPVRLYLDKDEADQPPGEGDDVIARQQRKIAKLSARLGEAEKMIELVKTEKHDELALLKAQMKVLHRRSQAAVDRAWELETQMEETERQSNVFFDIVAKERVALEQALHAKDQELKKAKSKEARYDKDVQDLKDSLADARKRDAEHMEQIGEAAHTMKRKQKKITRLAADYQLAKERERALQAALDALKASRSTSKHHARRPLQPLSPNSQRSDPELAEQDNFDTTEDNSLEVVSMFDDGDLDPSMDLLAGRRKRPFAHQPAPDWPMPAPKRRKLEKKKPLHVDVKDFLDPRTMGMKKGVVTGPGRRVKAKT